MRKYFITTAFVALSLVSCNKDITADRPSDAEISARQITFRVGRGQFTKSPEVVESLDSFYVTTSYGESATQPPVWANGLFRSDGHGTYGSAGTARLWPLKDSGYHFSASNIPMEHTMDGERVTVNSIDTDVVCAYLHDAEYQKTNTLEFNHILSRIGRISIEGIDNVRDIKLSIYCYLSGTYYLRSGKWAYPGSMQHVSLLLDGDNDIWIIPGRYQLTLACIDKATGKTLSKTWSETFEKGNCIEYNFKVRY